MPTTVTMPQLGESIHEGTIERWLKQPGDTVQEFDPLLEVMTDKVSIEVPAPSSGKLVTLLAQEGETVRSGEPICSIEEVAASGTARASEPAVSAGVPGAGREQPPPNKQIGDPATLVSSSDAPLPPATAAPSDPASRPEGEAHRYSPAVRAIAAEQHVDLSQITGSGLGGRVTRQDVLNFIEQGQQAPKASAPAVPAVPPPPIASTSTPPVSPPIPAAAPHVPAPARTAEPPRTPITPAATPRPAVAASLEGDERVPLSTMRRMIAEHMANAKSTVPHAWQAVEVDMSRVNTYRNQTKDAFRKREGISLSYLPFVIQATCQSLRENPAINASFAGDAIIRHRHINIGVAVGLEEGLVVPVLPDADGLNLAGIARGVASLADKARTRKLKPDDMQGGTFTVNNPGTFGSTLSYSIINAPQAGILTMEAVVDRVVVVDGMIAIRPIMFLCFSFDHRAMDGLQAARFLQGVRKHLEEFDADRANV